MIDKQVNKQLVKSLKDKKRKPSWFARHSRKKLIEKIIESLQEFNVVHAWAHEEFVSAIEKKPKTIVVYVEFKPSSNEGLANTLDLEMDKRFTKIKVNIIEVKSLLPAIKESVFNEVDAII